MATRKTEHEGVENFLGHVNELPSFVPIENPRITEDEQRRLEKRARIFFKEAMVKMRGKQWDLSSQDFEETRRICKSLSWQEGIAQVDKMRELLASRKSSDASETHSRVARERYNKNQMARAQRVTAEHARLDQLHQASEDRMTKLRKMIETSKNVEISRLAGLLNIDEAFVKDHVPTWADQFGFKTAANKIIFGNGNIDDFLDALGKQFSL